MLAEAWVILGAMGELMGPPFSQHNHQIPTQYEWLLVIPDLSPGPQKWDTDYPPESLQCPKWIKATRSGVTTRGVSRTFPSRGQGDLGEKARSKLSKGGFGQLPRRNLSEATVGSGPWHSACGMQLAQPSWRMATQHSMRNKEEETKPKNLFLGYSSSMELVGGQQLPVRWGQVAFPSMGTAG